MGFLEDGEETDPSFSDVVAFGDVGESALFLRLRSAQAFTDGAGEALAEVADVGSELLVGVKTAA